MAQVEGEGRRGWLHALIGMAGGCLVLLLIAVVLGYIALSRTGLVGPQKQVTVPDPVRVVEVRSTASEIQASLMKSALSSLSNGEITLALTDEMLTVLMRDGLAHAGEEAFDVDRAQVAVVEDGYLELFVPVSVNTRETALRAQIGLALVDGRVTASVGDVHVGRLKVPGSIVTSSSEAAIQRSLDSQLEEVQGALQLTDVHYEEGVLRLSGEIDFNPLQLLQ